MGVDISRYPWCVVCNQGVTAAATVTRSVCTQGAWPTLGGGGAQLTCVWTLHCWWYIFCVPQIFSPRLSFRRRQTSWLWVSVLGCDLWWSRRQPPLLGPQRHIRQGGINSHEYTLLLWTLLFGTSTKTSEQCLLYTYLSFTVIARLLSYGPHHYTLVTLIIIFN